MKEADLPYGFKLEKEKDMMKDRPVTSYAGHGAKKMLNVVSRGLTFLLKEMSVDHEQFVLWKTQDLQA